jgi:hypothetical protein
VKECRNEGISLILFCSKKEWADRKKDQAKYKLKFKVNFRAPENLLIFGKSGDSGRLNNDEVVGHCDPLVEREVRGESGGCFP